MKLRDLQINFKDTIKSTEDDILSIPALPIMPSTNFSVEERIKVYRNAYYIRISESLEEDFPKTIKLLGINIKDLTKDFLKEHPSDSYYLSNISSKFPRYIADKYPNTKASELAIFEWNECLASYGKEDDIVFQFSFLEKIPVQELIYKTFILYNYVNIQRSNYNLIDESLIEKQSFFVFSKESYESPSLAHQISELEFQIIEKLILKGSIAYILETTPELTPQKTFEIFKKLVELKIIKGVTQ